MLLILYGTGILNEAGSETFRLLEQHSKTIPGELAHWVAAYWPQSSVGHSILHILLIVCIPIFVLPFSYICIREWIYVDRMYVKRDLVEAGKLQPADLTPEEYHFIFVHWPELFKR